MSEAGRKIKDVLTELTEVVSRLDRTGDTTRFQHDVDRWKRRPTESLSAVVPRSELAPFKEISTEADSDADAARGVVEEHRAYLHSLLQDVKKHPGIYGAGAVQRVSPPVAPPAKPQAPVPATAAPVVAHAPLSLPERVTLAWLWHNVPWGFWAAMGGLLLAALILGLKLGLTPAIARIVGPVLGIEASGQP